MDFLCFSMDLRSSGARGVGRPFAACGILWHPQIPCGSGLDPPNIKISDSGGPDLEAWSLDAGCWKHSNGLEEVTEVTAFWGEGF